MRTMTILLLILAAACIAHADGMALSKLLPMITETDQVAVIALDRTGVNLDMYIAIDGIPADQTVTYVLPFWHRPEGFSLEQMDGKAFYSAYTQSAQQRVSEENKRLGRAWSGYAYSASLLGVCGAGPYSVLALCGGLLCVPRVMGGGKHGLSPYQVNSTPNVKAELYHVPRENLRALVEKAGLPARYTQVLRRYNTEYYAVMHLTGTGKKEPQADQDEKPSAVDGVHYHFRHPMSGAEEYTYTYPLGTGGGWANPIKLTDIYITCAPGWSVDVKAPTYGQQTSYTDLLWGLQDTEKPTKLSTGSLMDDPPPSPGAWHRAYVMANPSEDITVHFARRRFSLQRAVEWLMADSNGMLIIPLLNMLLAWAYAIGVFLRGKWRQGGCVGPFSAQALPVLLYALIPGVATSIILLGCGIYTKSIFAPVPILQLIFSAFCMVLYGAMLVWYYRVKSQSVPLESDAIANPIFPTFTGNPRRTTLYVAVSCYILLSLLDGMVLDWLVAR